MDMRLIGWAGVELRDGGSSLVIDPLSDAGAVWAWAGDRAESVPLPAVIPAEPGAAAGLVTHLHRDHADGPALAAALARGAPILEPAPFGGGGLEEAALTVADRELAETGRRRQTLTAWERVEIDGWSITALPAADGPGDPQVSWLVTRGGATVVHAGDTLVHGWWWRVAERAQAPIDVAFLPVNGAHVDFRHRRPASPLRAAMNAEEAFTAATTMRARQLVPMHYGAYHFPPVYVPDPDPVGELRALGADPLVPGLGEWFTP
jgi:L-ascorbate metabolism protein UlaG (beta-lactamase superfamily)